MTAILIVRLGGNPDLAARKKLILISYENSKRFDGSMVWTPKKTKKGKWLISILKFFGPEKKTYTRQKIYGFDNQEEACAEIRKRAELYGPHQIIEI